MRCEPNVSRPGSTVNTAQNNYGPVNPIQKLPLTVYTPFLPPVLLLEPSAGLPFHDAVSTPRAIRISFSR